MRDTEELITCFLNGLRRNCETDEWEPVDVALPYIDEPYRSRLKAIEKAEKKIKEQARSSGTTIEVGALLYRPDGTVLVRR